MKRTRLLISSLACVAFTAACSSPPTPPTVDEATRRPANTTMAVELQVCRSDLQNIRLEAAQRTRLAESTAQTLTHMTAWLQLASSRQPLAQPVPAANTIYTVRFEFRSSRFDLPAEAAQLLIGEAKAAPLVLLRGRTDGLSDSAAEIRIARERATAMKDYLVAAGVEPSKIRLTYQPTGDHVADNLSHAGRALNRRVEIEIYRIAPVAMTWNPAAE